MDARIEARAKEAIEQRIFPGCVIGVMRGSAHEFVAFGNHAYGPASRAVTEDSLYDCASITKSIPTATLALQLIDEGALSLETKLVEIVPEYATPHREAVRLKHLLTYTLGNTTPLSRAGATPEEIFETVCHEETYPPGVVFSYSNTPAFLLGLALERVTGMPLDQASRERMFEPLEMRSTSFHNNGHRTSTIVPAEEGVHGVVHDESARIFARAGKTVGHAGLFSTARDLLKFLGNLLAHPDDRLSTNQIAHLGARTALGWELDQPWMAALPRTFGKTGFTGTCVAANFEKETALVILSNRTYPARPQDASAITALRRAVCAIVFA